MCVHDVKAMHPIVRRGISDKTCFPEEKYNGIYPLGTNCLVTFESLKNGGLCAILLLNPLK